MSSDSELLRQFAESRDEAAFAEVVHRHADLVYSVALRMARNDALAQDVTQSVFTKLAGQAAILSRYDTIIGWLHTTARNSAIDVIRGEERRRAREQESFLMQNNSAAAEVNWESIGPLLDEAVGTLREDDRKAVLLRFFKNLSHQEVGAALGLSEDTARKRVERALEKLRTYFTSRGVTASSALLAVTITANSVQAAPVGLAEKIAPISLASVGGAGVGSAFLLALIMSTKTKIIIVSVVILAIAATLAVKLRNSDQGFASPSSMPSASGGAPAHIAAGLPKAATPPPQVAAPSTKPAPASATTVDTAVAATASLTQARIDLKTYVPTIIHLLETNDFVGIIDCVMQPDEVANELRGGITRDQLAVKLHQELENHGGATTLLNALRSIEGREPTLDVTGTHAAYKLDVSFEGHDEIEFTKVNGLWYGPN